MERFVRRPHSAFMVGVALAVIILFAVLILGAPPMVLIPISLIGATVYAEMSRRIDRREHSPR